MCTAITYQTRDHYFGRNLDLEYHYNEQITITPRSFPFSFTNGKNLKRHHALIGMATVAKNYPLYYEATNEKGLSMAGLNFPGNAHYFPTIDGKDNVSPFEFIPWLLCQCATLHEARALLQRINLCNIPFSEQFPLSPLHWLIADRNGSIVVESMQNGLHIHENPVGVLTNNPPFDWHMMNLNNYMHLSTAAPENRFSDQITLKPYSLGMGGIGLPGDLSSASRFVRAAFTRLNAQSGESEEESVSQFFHILGSVSQPRGLNEVRPHEYEITVYASCCNTDKGVYYCHTYENARIVKVDMHRENLDGKKLITYPLPASSDILSLN